MASIFTNINLIFIVTTIYETNQKNISEVEEAINLIKLYYPNTPYLIMASNSELKTSEKILKNENFVGVITKEKGEKFAEKKGAIGYFECSARTGEGCLDLIPRVIQLKKDWEEKKEKEKEKNDGKCILC